MADDLKKWQCGQDYVPVGAGAAGITIHNDAGYQAIRIAITDSDPDSPHDVYMTLKGGETVNHFELPTGFAVYVRTDASQGQARGHYRAYE